MTYIHDEARTDGAPFVDIVLQPPIDGLDQDDSHRLTAATPQPYQQ